MSKAILVVSAPTPANTNISGLLDYTGLAFSEDLEIWRGGVELITGLAPGGQVDVYPGINPATGDIMFTTNQPDLEVGEVLVMEDRGMTRACIATPVYDSSGPKTLSIRAWAERGGQRINNPTSAILAVYDRLDNLVISFPLNTLANARGIFSFEQTGVVLVKGQDYYIDVQIVASGVTVQNNRAWAEY